MRDGHMPVLAEEVMSMLQPAAGSLQIDATVGGGGHTERILEATNPDGRLLGLDADGAAIARVRERLARFGDRLILRQANFRELGAVAPEAGFGAVDGCLFDLGLSSFQLADACRRLGKVVPRDILRHMDRYVRAEENRHILGDLHSVRAISAGSAASPPAFSPGYCA